MSKEVARTYPIMPITVATTGNWRYQSLYVLDMRGELREWLIGFDEHAEQLVMISGLVDGTAVVSRADVKPLSNRTLQEQASLEAITRYTNKMRKGYSHNPTDLGGEKDFYRPMLSEDYNPKRHLKLSKTVVLQPKIDGVRNMSYIYNGTIIHKSRGDIQRPHLGFLDEHLMTCFSCLPPNSMIDGEIYFHGASL